MKVDKYDHAFGCYGMPIGIKVSVRQYPAVAKEGKRKKICRDCLALAIDAFRRQLVESANEALGRPCKSNRPMLATRRGNRRIKS